MVLTESRRDFLQKYGECYVRIKRTGKKEEGLFLISNVDDKLRGHLLDKDGLWTASSLLLNTVEIDTSMPELGMVNVKNTAMYIYRKAGKQYRQGFSYKNNLIVGNSITSNMAPAPSLNEGSTVTSIFNPIYYSIEESISSIMRKKKLAVAITSRYYISVSPLLPYIYLGFMGMPIGRVDESTATCYLFEQASQYINIGGVERGI